MGLTATFTHMLLWNYDDISPGWAWINLTNFKKFTSGKLWKFWGDQETPEQRYARKESDPSLDPHYKLMLRNLYLEVPLWWWAAILVR
jgi:hypothetical protein